jgi:hypothetical protein
VRIGMEGHGVIYRRLALVAVVIALCTIVWASDKIGYEGERTIYTVQCQDGNWEGWRCTGKMVASDRYRFRASKSKREVVYWIVGSSIPSGKYSDCAVRDRGNWTCNVNAGQPASITREMVNGRPTSTDGELNPPFHAVRKWEWWVLRAGIHVYTTADN